TAIMDDAERVEPRKADPSAFSFATCVCLSIAGVVVCVLPRIEVTWRGREQLWSGKRAGLLGGPFNGQMSELARSADVTSSNSESSGPSSTHRRRSSRRRRRRHHGGEP